MELLTPLVKSIGKKIPEEQVIQIGIDLCNALIACKQQNVIHRDIKPQNIFVSKDGLYKLGDFGIAKTSERTTSGTKAGTFKYMVPEVYKGEAYGAKADQYSLGMVLYWLLNERRTPFLPLPPAVPTNEQENEARVKRFSGEPFPVPRHGSKALHQEEVPTEHSEPKPSQRKPRKTKPAENKRLPKWTAIPVLAACLALVLWLGLGNRGKQATENSESPSPVALTDWSVWGEELPDGVSMDEFLIEEKTLYSSRTLEMKTDADHSEMAGWELYQTDESGSYTDWSEWSEEEMESSEDREVETELRYRARDKETKTGSSPTMAGWTLEDTKDNYGNWGSWSSWSESPVTGSDTRQVEQRTEYSYQTTGSRQTASHRFTIAVVGSGDDGDSFWSAWSPTKPTSYSNLRTRVVYRYRTRTKTTTYHFMRWGEWSEWTADELIASDKREVETTEFYRFREKLDKPVYHFRRWTDWSEFTEEPIETGETVEVRTKTVYRYKQK